MSCSDSTPRTSPHAWEAGVLYDTTTETLFCGDLFTWHGSYAATTNDDIVGPAVQAEDEMPGSLSLHPSSGATCRRLAELNIHTLAPLHAPAYAGDCRAAPRSSISPPTSTVASLHSCPQREARSPHARRS